MYEEYTGRSHLPRGRCGLKLVLHQLLKQVAAVSPSARKVWIEITPEVANTDNTTSPSARKVWIEIIIEECYDFDSIGHLPRGRCGLKFFRNRNEKETEKSHLPRGRCGLKSSHGFSLHKPLGVTFREEGVDWNYKVVIDKQLYKVTFREEGVDWNTAKTKLKIAVKVTFREEGVDWNFSSASS